jgi:SAM-dependent methyltransferase
VTYDRAAVYAALLGGTTYGKGNHWRPVWWRIQQLAAVAPGHGRRHLLDVGCGRGELLAEASAIGMRAEGCDIAPCQAWITQATLPVLPYPDRAWDIVCCFDVIEHLPPADVPAAIAELLRVCCGTVLLSVATIPHVVHVDGHGPCDLHLTQWPLPRWHDAMDAAVCAVAGWSDWVDIPTPGQPLWRHYMEATHA